MPILSEGQFEHAMFVNSKKDLIKAIWYDSENKEHEELVISAVNSNPDYKKLLEQFTIDEIATMTDQYSKEHEELFLEVVKKIATESGMIYDPSVLEDKNNLALDSIFEPTDDEIGTDLLFNIKLKIFEIEEVLNSDNAILKKALREAKTPIEAFYIAGKFLYE